MLEEPLAITVPESWGDEDAGDDIALILQDYLLAIHKCT